MCVIDMEYYMNKKKNLEREKNMVLNYTTLCIDNAIEITWIYQELAKEGKILSIKDVGNFGFIKETIIEIATEFEKEYVDLDWKELDYLDCLRKYAEDRLIKVFGR